MITVYTVYNLIYTVYTVRRIKMKIIISNTSKDPIYEQIEEQIKESILKGEIEPGATLPSIRNLAKELKISVITTKHSYEELEREGLIETVPGKGSYVSSCNKEFLKERKIKEIESNLMDAINSSQLIGLTKNELKEMIDILYDNI